MRKEEQSAKLGNSHFASEATSALGAPDAKFMGSQRTAATNKSEMKSYTLGEMRTRKLRFFGGNIIAS
jgi:hypothetical protein